MSDETPNQPQVTQAPAEDTSGPIAITTLACALGGIALIISFFLPLLIFKPDRLEGFQQRSEAIINAIDLAEDVAEPEGQISIEKLRELDPTSNNENVSEDRRGRMLERIAGVQPGEPITVEHLRNARSWIVTIRNLMFVPSLWHLFNVADRLEKDKERTLAFGERLGLDSRMLKIVSGVRIFLLSLPVAGLVALAMALVMRFRKLNAFFLILLFLSGAALTGASGLLGGYGYACDHPETFASVPAVQPLLMDLPFTIGPGTWAVLGGSLMFLFASMFGVTRRNFLACYGFYLLLGAGVAVFWVYWIGEQRANPPAEGAPPAPAAPAQPGTPANVPANGPAPENQPVENAPPG